MWKCPECGLNKSYVLAEVCPECKRTPPQREQGAVEYDNKFVVMEGRLEVSRTPYVNPIDCTCGCDINDQLRPSLTGLTCTETGATSLSALESALENLNGKKVRITIEWSE